MIDSQGPDKLHRQTNGVCQTNGVRHLETRWLLKLTGHPVRRDKSVDVRRCKSVDRGNQRLSVELRNLHLIVLTLLGEGGGNIANR